MKTFKLKPLIENTDIRNLLKIFPFIFMLHELEEWNILHWHRQFQTNIPPDVANIDLRTFFLFIILLFFALTYLCLIPKNKKINSYLLLPFIIMGSFYNGIVHLYWSFHFQTYAPGVIFGFFISVPFALLIIYKMLKENLVKKWYVLIFVVLSVILVIQAMNHGDKLEPGIINAMLFGKKLAQWFWY
jgi:hypothetical protein